MNLWEVIMEANLLEARKRLNEYVNEHYPVATGYKPSIIMESRTMEDFPSARPAVPNLYSNEDKEKVQKAAEEGFNTGVHPGKPYGPFPLPKGHALSDTAIDKAGKVVSRCMFHYNGQQCLYERGHQGGHRVN